MKRQYIFPAFFLFSLSLFSQTIPVQSCAYHWCSGAVIEDMGFKLEVSPDAQSPVSDIYLENHLDFGCTQFQLPESTLPSNVVRITPLKTPVKDGNPLNGITTYEYIMNVERISRHIDGTQPFTETWQWFAADVNMDGVVSEADLTTLHDLILGIYNEQPPVSWRFVPKSYVVINPANPLQDTPPGFISKSVAELNVSEDFWGVQLGRVLSGSVCGITGTTSPVVFAASEAWPNPTKGSFSVQLNLQQAAELHGEIFDRTGRRLAKQAARIYPAGSTTFDFDAAGAAGLYFWKITDGAGRYQMGKVAVQ